MGTAGVSTIEHKRALSFAPQPTAPCEDLMVRDLGHGFLMLSMLRAFSIQCTLSIYVSMLHFCNSVGMSLQRFSFDQCRLLVCRMQRACPQLSDDSDESEEVAFSPFKDRWRDRMRLDSPTGFDLSAR